MRKENGVYALVMRLESHRTIKIGQLGIFDFDSGWYIYLGTAHGAGGLSARTNRHRRGDSDKRKKWNIDYLRQFAPISEIWFSHAPQYREHDWSWSVMRIHGAKIPARKFGANDCYPYCYTHLYHFKNRPFVNAMRADLLSKGSHHQPIYVEPVEPYVSDPVSLQSTYGDLLKQYDRGRRFLERRQRSYYDGRSQIDMSERNLSFAKQTFDIRLLTEMAKEMNVSPALLKDDIKLASAVDTLVQNCNADVYGALFHEPHPQSRKAIMSLSRTSDLRQQHRIQGVLDRRFRSVAPQVNDDDFETVAYDEVPSRLRRARGGIEKLECMIEDSGEPDAPLHR